MNVPPTYPEIFHEVDGHQLIVSVSGASRLAALEAIIDQAERSLRLFFYYFSDDATGRKIRARLLAACNRGVAVTLLIDGFGSSNQPDSVFAELVDAGAIFARFNPRFGRRYLLRNHQKMVIADDAKVLVGGSNVADHYFADDPAGQSWHDLFLTLSGPVAARVADYFDALHAWIAGESVGMRSLVNILAKHSDSGGAVRLKLGGPFQRLSPLTRGIRRDIDTAARLDLVQAYFAPNWGMLRRLVGLVRKRRGEVRIITASRSDNGTTVAAARHCYRRLLAGGVAVHEYRPQMLHMKLIVADDAVYIGSANFDMRSLFINAEIMMRIEHAGFAGSIRKMIDAHIPHCEEITRSSHQKHASLLTRLRWFVGYFIVSTVDFTVTRRANLRRT